MISDLGLWHLTSGTEETVSGSLLTGHPVLLLFSIGRQAEELVKCNCSQRGVMFPGERGQEQNSLSRRRLIDLLTLEDLPLAQQTSIAALLHGSNSPADHVLCRTRMRLLEAVNALEHTYLLCHAWILGLVLVALACKRYRHTLLLSPGLLGLERGPEGFGRWSLSWDFAAVACALPIDWDEYETYGFRSHRPCNLPIIIYQHELYLGTLAEASRLSFLHQKSARLLEVMNGSEDFISDRLEEPEDARPAKRRRLQSPIGDRSSQR